MFFALVLLSGDVAWLELTACEGGFLLALASRAVRFHRFSAPSLCWWTVRFFSWICHRRPRDGCYGPGAPIAARTPPLSLIVDFSWPGPFLLHSAILPCLKSRVADFLAYAGSLVMLARFNSIAFRMWCTGVLRVRLAEA